MSSAVRDRNFQDLSTIQVDDAFIFAAAAPTSVVWTGTDAGETKGGSSIGDTLNGAGGNDDLNGYSGDDVLDGGIGDDSLDGAEGSDVLLGGDGNDELYGQGGNDVLDSGMGPVDYLAGGSGDDVYYVRHSRAYVLEETNRGNDTVIVFTAEYAIGATESIEVIRAADGLGFGQKLTGSSAANTIYGGIHSDTLDGGRGADFLAGGAGHDTYRLDSIYDVVHEEAGNGIDTVIVQFDYALGANVETLEAAANYKIAMLTGNSLANTIMGNSFSNRLYGGSGNDHLSGGGGQDTLIGGLGKDVLEGGGGTDFFVFDRKLKSSNRDRILDFNVKEDYFFLDNKYFKALGRKGSEKKPLKLKKDAFYIGTKARDEEDRIIYNKKKGVLYYDPDGIGPKSKMYFAKIDKKLKLKYHDFYIV